MRRFLSLIAAHTETRALLLWLTATGAVAAFLSLADEVSEGETAAIDRHLLLSLRGADPSDPLGPGWVEEAMRDVTALGGVTVLSIVIVTALCAFAFNGKRRHALILAGVVVAAQISSEVLKAFYDRPRPSLVPHGVSVYSQSFPSGHSMMAAATYLMIATLVANLEPQRSTKALVYVLACLLIVAVGFSRVYLGVHWPSDVFGGWCLGSAWALAGWILLKWPSRAASRAAN